MITKKDKLLRFVSIVILFILFYAIYKTQIDYQMGDIPAHIRFSLEKKGYSLNVLMFYLLCKYTLPNYYGVAVFLAIITCATVYASFFLISYMNKNAGGIVSNRALWVISCSLPFIASTYIPYVYPFFYKDTISPIVWHNATVIEMRLFAILSLAFFFKMMESERILWQDWVLFSLFLLIANAFKPSYVVGFAPIAGIWMLIIVLNNKTSFGKMFVVGVGILLSMIPLVYQWIELYGDNEGGLEFVLGGRLLQTGNPYLKLICGLSFPVIIFFFILCERKVNSASWGKYVFFVYGMMLTNLFMYCFVLEKNDGGAGNIAWGLKAILYIVYLIDGYVLVMLYPKRKRACILLSIIPVVQLLSGIIYTIILLCSHVWYI